MGAAERTRTPRRAPAPAERGKTAEQTRERIVRAAVEEFGAKGYAGARTAAIAARAGVNPQLISYYFGGKEGLLDALRRRWAQAGAGLAPPGATFAESVAAYLDATLDQPSWARLVIWQALGDHPADAGQQVAEQRAKLREAVERTRRRQRDGELTDDVEAEFILLLAHIVAFAPIAMPQIIEAIYGIDPLSTEFRRRCQEALVRLVDPERSPR